MPFLSSIKSVASGLRTKSREQKPIGVGFPPSDPPHDPTLSPPQLPPIKRVDLPQVAPEHQFALHDQGWTKVTYDEPNDTDRLYSSSQALFRASKAFFDLPASKKEAYRTKAGTEEGWSHVEGEKEFITLRSIENTPDELKHAASEYWETAGTLLNDMIGEIARSLGLPPDALTVFSEPCSTLGVDKTATLLRLFRYEGFEKDQPKIVAEPHRDLGMLSLVVGDTPGLEVWDRHAQQWFPIERTFTSPAASIMCGRQIERLTNSRYHSGGHLVRAYPDMAREEETNGATHRYRYSAVFVLRAHYPVPIDSDKLTTTITGPFKKPLRDMTGEEFFKGIQRAHFNINTGLDERNKQRQDLAAKKTEAATVALDPASQA